MKERMELLPNDMILTVSYHLDEYHKQLLSFTCNTLKDMFYDKTISNRFNDIHVTYKQTLCKCFNTISNIGKNGIIHGECEDCCSKGLLYESLNPNPRQQPTKWICLEKCTFTCLTCETKIHSRSRNGWHDPIMCLNRHTRINTFVWE